MQGLLSFFSSTSQDMPGNALAAEETEKSFVRDIEIFAG
jgi:hypothetical protein